MKNQSSGNGDELFDGEADVRAMFQSSVPVAPAFDFDGLPPMTSQATPRNNRKLTRRVALAIATGLAASSATALVLLRPRLTFAQVQEEVSATKSVRYEWKKLGELANQDIQYAKGIIENAKYSEEKFAELYGSKSAEEQQEIRERTAQSLREAERYLKQRDKNPPYDRVFVLGRYLQRQERRGVSGEIVDITDMTTGKSIRLNHKDRTATVFTSQTTISAKTGEKKTKEIVEKPNLEVDFYSSIHNIPGDAEPLDETRTINGTLCVGFRASSTDGPYTRIRTFWVDKKTKLPKQIDIRLRSDDKFYSPADFSMVNIEFDVKLDKALFSTDIPAGYKVKKSGFVDITE